MKPESFWSIFYRSLCAECKMVLNETPSIDVKYLNRVERLVLLWDQHCCLWQNSSTESTLERSEQLPEQAGRSYSNMFGFFFSLSLDFKWILIFLSSSNSIVWLCSVSCLCLLRFPFIQVISLVLATGFVGCDHEVVLLLICNGFTDLKNWRSPLDKSDITSLRSQEHGQLIKLNFLYHHVMFICVSHPLLLIFILYFIVPFCLSGLVYCIGCTDLHTKWHICIYCWAELNLE